MFPSLASLNRADGPLSDAELFGEHSLAKVATPDRHHVGLAELGGPNSFTDDTTSSVCHLGQILSQGAKVQVGRLAADRPVARMQNAQPVGRTMVDPVRSNVGMDNFSTHPELAVSLSGRRRPIPASFSRWVSGHEPRKGFGFRETWRSFIAATCKRIAMPAPTHVVGPAVSLAVMFAIAIGNHAHAGHTTVRGVSA